MNAKIKNRKLVIELDLHDAKPSISEKTLGVAGTKGLFQTCVTNEGQNVWVYANALIYPPGVVQSKQKPAASKHKRRKAAKKLTNLERAPVANVEIDEEELFNDEY